MIALNPVPRKCDKRERWTRPVRSGLPAVIIGSAILIALGGGTHPLTLGLLTAVLGLVIAVRPPVNRIHGVGGLCWAALLTWILLALWLPAPAAEWRQVAENLGISISSAVTPQPVLTIEALIAFLAGSALLLLALEHKPDSSQRRQCIHLLAGALTILAVGAIIAASFGWRLPWANLVHVFSWFPNRNQTALTFACGSVLCFGLAVVPWYRHSLRQLSSIVAHDSSPVAVYKATLWLLLCSFILLYAVFQSLSKGALIAWSFGMLTLVVVLAASANRDTSRLLRFAPSLAILLFSFFVFLGGNSRDRMMDFIVPSPSDAGDSSAITEDFRWQIYTDTAPMIADQLWTGVGLGQFRYIFPQYRSLPAAQVTMLHPESDWLWWTAELGLVGLGCIVLGLGALLFRLRDPKDENPKDSSPNSDALDRVYRNIAIAALVPFFVHSFVDVGAHRLGTVSLAIILYVLALPKTPETALPRKFVRQTWRYGGVVFFLAGAVIISLVAIRSPLLSTYAPTAEEPLPTAPLQWQPYFRSAVQAYADDPQAALDAFDQARFLMADNAEIPLQIGLFLLRRGDHEAAFEAFRSAIQRSSTPFESFRQILQRTASKQAHHVRLRSMAQSNGALIAAYWSAVPPEIFKAEEAIAELTADWLSLPAQTQRFILERLSKRKMTDRVQALFESSSVEQQKQTWSAVMQALVAEDRWEEAMAILDQWIERKPLPENPVPDEALRQLQSAAVIHSDDPVVGSRLIHAYLSRRMWDDVRRTAERIRTLPGSPPDILYWLGLALSETNRRKEAASAYGEWLSQPGE